MRKARQILAIIGIIILVGMYVATIICALSANENFMSMLMASIYASAVIPVLIWAIIPEAGLYPQEDHDDRPAAV